MTSPVVNAHNEWDPLEEIIVGVLDGQCVTPWEPGFGAMIPDEKLDLVRSYHQMNAGKPYTSAQVMPAQRELDEFVHILEVEGVTVRRPDPMDCSIPFSTPDFPSTTGYGDQYPARDALTAIGDEIIEATMSWRSRYHAILPYRRLIKEYLRQGARWVSAPRPQMSDELYLTNHRRDPNSWEWVTTEFEPVFDAADIIRCGKDIFVQRSHTTNESGIEWLRRHLGDTYRVHRVEFHDHRAVHIDATFVPLAPGKMLVNPDRPIKELPSIFKNSGWELLPCPRTTYPKNRPDFRSFEWLVMNVVSLDEQRIIVEKEEETFIRALKDWGFKPIPVAYRNCYKHGGSFHCSTCDIRRRGTLQTYF
ncbi:amidinotransferase [Sorangium sp. So ce1128]